MRSFIESHIGLLERGLASTDLTEVEDQIAFHLTALERLEWHLGDKGLQECHRPLVPLFQRWLQAARKVKDAARTLRASGAAVKGYDDLLRAMNRSKPVADSFDHFVELNRQLAGEDASANGANR